MWCCMDVLGVMVCLSRHYRDEVILIFLSLGSGFPLNFYILVRGSPLFFDNSGFLTPAALRWAGVILLEYR